MFRADQFSQPSDQNIYVFGPHTAPEDVIAAIESISKTLHFHVAVLQGNNISSMQHLLDQLAKVYQFPVPTNHERRINIDSASDYLGDLEWLMPPNASSAPLQGFLLIYTHPATIIHHDPIGFALCMDMFMHESRHHIRDGRPFFLILGPLDHTSNIFIRTLKVSDYIVYPPRY